MMSMALGEVVQGRRTDVDRGSMGPAHLNLFVQLDLLSLSFEDFASKDLPVVEGERLHYIGVTL